ncbi:hypothetical protein Pmani_008809 [Petrolisthes manimaculis]|uniref:Endonuclease 8-like 3 n=1 Tax=Petrolisthes manimaculis TaxID=1843537 RepID=A0AAE1Q5J5_9EUCA|nr:hypothetical protein Pmani_008809 [Petrolisthes manimaculis]
MVEGPGCKLKGEALKSRARGQTVDGISGTVVERKRKSTRDNTSSFDCLVGMKLTDVKTLGKELFAIFENDACLRIHFLMAGCIRFNKEAQEFGSTRIATPTLKLSLSRDEVAFLGTSVEMRSSAECVQKYSELIDVDICSPTFDSKRATQSILDQPDRLVCDILLDQLVLPGVGNIIKNEALFNAGINPNSKVSQLSEDLVALLVMMNRDFTKIFYKCRKEGTSLSKFLNVYKKQKCVECRGKLIQTKIGEYERLTFWCRSCQTNTQRSHTRLPKRSSLLGWVIGTKDQVAWSCGTCTLVNKPANNKCSVCLTPRQPHSSRTHGWPATPQHSHVQCSYPIPPGVSLPCTNSLTTKPHPSPISLTALSHSSPSSLTTHSLPSPPSFGSSSTLSTPASPSYSSPDVSQTPQLGQKHFFETTESPLCTTGRKYKFRKLGVTFHESQSDPIPTQARDLPIQEPGSSCQPTAAATSKEYEERSGVVLCGHRESAKKFRVVKDNENKGRIFYTCSKPAATRCNFFMWGDEHHPLCGHGKRCLIRTVLKQNSNNGRQFYCCPLTKKKQCDFFQWV